MFLFEIVCYNSCPVHQADTQKDSCT